MVSWGSISILVMVSDPTTERGGDKGLPMEEET
jgi:hypothetical protein